MNLAIQVAATNDFWLSVSIPLSVLTLYDHCNLNKAWRAIILNQTNIIKDKQINSYLTFCSLCLICLSLEHMLFESTKDLPFAFLLCSYWLNPSASSCLIGTWPFLLLVADVKVPEVFILLLSMQENGLFDDERDVSPWGWGAILCLLRSTLQCYMHLFWSNRYELLHLWCIHCILSSIYSSHSVLHTKMQISIERISLTIWGNISCLVWVNLGSASISAIFLGLAYYLHCIGISD